MGGQKKEGGAKKKTKGGGTGHAKDVGQTRWALTYGAFNTSGGGRLLGRWSGTNVVATSGRAEKKEGASRGTFYTGDPASPT